MSDEGSRDDLVRRLAGAVEGHLSAHPDAGAFLAYRRGELAEAEADAFEEHLAWCRDCAGIARDLPGFLEGEAEAEPFAPEEKAADWAAIEERLGREGSAGGPEAAYPKASASRSRLASALAAAVALVVVGGGFWAFQAQRREADRLRPVANVPPVNLSPVGTERGGGGGLPTLTLERGAYLSLGSRRDLGDRAYRAAIVGEDGRTRWTVDGLRPTEYGSLSLLLPSGSLPPGRYRIVVRGEARGPEVERYAFRVVAAAPE